MLRPVEIIFRFFYNVMNIQFGMLNLHNTSCQCGVYVLDCVVCSMGFLLCSCFVFSSVCQVIQVLLSCAEVVHVECLHVAHMILFFCDIQYSYRVSTEHKLGASLHYRKS
jgi:hypothetical protein